MAENINDKNIINPLPLTTSGNETSNFLSTNIFNTTTPVDTNQSSGLVVVPPVKKRIDPVYVNININNKTEYLITSNSVKLLPYFDNQNQYVRLYTSLNSNLKLGDRVFLLYDPSIILDTNDIILDSYLTFSGYTDIFYYVKATHGYKVIDLDSTNNIVVIDKLYLKEYKDKTINGHYLTKTYIKNIYIKGGSIDGTIMLNCQLNESDTIINDVDIVQSIILSGNTFYTTFNDKYDNNYNTLKSVYNNTNDDGSINKITYINKNNDLKGFTYIKENNITGSTIYNGTFYKCVLFNSLIYNGYFEECILDNSTIYNGFFKNCQVLSNCNWTGGTWFENLYTGETLVTMSGFELEVWNNGTWNGGNFYNKTWLTGVFNDGNFHGENINKSTWYNGIFNNGNMYNSKWYNGIFNNGTINTIYWYNGVFNNGIFYNSVWSGGTFYNGMFQNSDWMIGDFYDGNFLRSNWYDGNFYNGEIKGINLYNDPDVLFEWFSGNFYNGKIYGMIIYNINFHDGEMDTCYILGGSYFGGTSIYSTINCDDNTEINIIKNMSFKFLQLYNPVSPKQILIENCTFNDITLVIENDGEVIFNKCVFDNIKQEILSSNLEYVTMNYCKVNSGTFGLNDHPDYYGEWNEGDWFNGTFSGKWNNGTFYNGIFKGRWYGGLWVSGVFSGSTSFPVPIPPRSTNFIPYTPKQS
jgi:hypothetical protein